MVEDHTLVPFEGAGFVGERAPGMQAGALTQVLQYLESLPFGDNAFSLKRRRYQEIGRVREIGLDVAVKRWRAPLRLPVRDPARRAGRCSLWLMQAGVPTPELLAVLAARAPSRSVAGWLTVHRWLPEHRPMNLLLAGHRPYHVRLRPALGGLAHLAARLHLGGLGHRDLRLENVLAREGFTDLHLVDVDEVQEHASRSMRGAAFDLGNLIFHLRRTDIPDHTSRRLLVLYGRERELARDQLRGLACRAFWRATYRRRWRQVRRCVSWIPGLRAPKSAANTPEKVARVYGVDEPAGSNGVNRTGSPGPGAARPPS